MMPRIPPRERDSEEGYRRLALGVNYALKKAGSKYPPVQLRFDDHEESHRKLANAVNSLLTTTQQVPIRFEEEESYRRLAAAINSVL